MYTAGALSQVIKEKHQLNGKRFKDDYSLKSKNVELSFFTFQAFWPVHCIKFRAILLPKKEMHLERANQKGEIDILSHQKPDHRKRWGTHLDIRSRIQGPQ